MAVKTSTIVNPENPSSSTATPSTPEAVSPSSAPGAQPGTQQDPSPPAAPSDPESSTERPGWLPEKFKTPEDLAKAYSELEKKQGSKNDPKIPNNNDKNASPNVENAAENAGLDFDGLVEKYSQNGKIDPSDYEAFAKIGIDNAVVDAYIAGQEAIQAQFTSEVHSLAGGEEKYAQLTAWASENLTDEAIDALNDMLGSGDTTKAEIAVSIMQAQFSEKQGTSPERELSGAGSSGSAAGFGSREEMAQAMQDPRYWKDVAYRTDVERRIQASRFS